MTGAELVAAVRHAGHRITLRTDGRIRCEPAPSPELANAIRAGRPAVLDALRTEVVKDALPSWHDLEEPGAWWEDERGHLHWCGPW